MTPNPVTAMTRTTARPLALLAVLALLSGCGGRGEPVGGAHTPKANETRKLAETYAVAAVVGSATAEVRVHPELEKKPGLSGIVSWFKGPGKAEVTVSTTPPVVVVSTTPAAPPVAPQPPAVAESGPRPPRIELSTRPVPPPSGSVVVRERVTSEIPLPTESEADDAALVAAADRLHAEFLKLDPPLDYRPSPAAVKADFLRRDSRLVRPPTDAEKAALARVGYAADRMYVEYTVEATAEQVREVRGRERVAGGLKLFALLAAAAGVGFVFLRVDAWSQGYLTSWLAFVAAALAGGAVVAYVFA